MAKKKLYKSKTNFTLKRLHQSGSYGHIYERDYTTIPSTTVLPEGQIPTYNSPSFGLTVRAGYNGQKKYNYGEWVGNPSECGGNTNSWTLSCMPEPNISDSKVVVKPNAVNLTSYVYFGSANELIKATIGNIVTNFPAEIYVTDKTVNDTGLLERSDITSTVDLQAYGDYYVIDNPFMIDLTQLTIPENSIVNPLRYMCESYYKYNVIKGDNTTSIMNWEIFSEETPKCINNGDKLASIKFSNLRNETLIIIDCFYLDGDILYITNSPVNTRIRPNDDAVNEFFNSLDDFEKILLNQYTDYTAKFETFEESYEDGWYMHTVDYKWPTSQGDWNLALNGKAYNDYVNSLSILTEGYDSLFTNVIWRTMAHESITNMDLTFTRNDELTELPNSSKLNMMLNIFGRQFDEIKKYIDNIKNSRRVTYDQNGCMPDYFLSDELGTLGWDVKTVLNDVSNDIITPPMYGARTLGFTSSDANAEFMRRLSLNSKRVFRKKGTKMGIEDLLAVFGYHSLDWLRRSKNVSIVKASDTDLRRAYVLHEYTYVVNGYAKDIKGNDLISNVKRLNELKDSFPVENLNNDEYIDSYYGLPVAEVLNPENEEESTLIPWFDKDVKYDGDMYFQMKGGWSGFDNDGKRTYEHTVSRIHFVPKQSDLFELNYYKIDENGLYFVGEEGKYYKIKNLEQHQQIEGWKHQDKFDVNELKKLEEAENIIDYNKGNNPHTGLYDDGYGYLNTYASLFSNATFENARIDEIGEKVETYGFNIERQEDLTKCVFLKDSLVNGEENKMLYNRLRPKTTIRPRNPFKNKDNSIEYTEIAGTSIMNNKVFHIEFDDAHKDFIEKDILPYVKQMIPSTTIFSYSFKRLTGDELDSSKAKTCQIICDGDTCPIYGVA